METELRKFRHEAGTLSKLPAPVNGFNSYSASLDCISNLGSHSRAILNQYTIKALLAYQANQYDAGEGGILAMVQGGEANFTAEVTTISCSCEARMPSGETYIFRLGGRGKLQGLSVVDKDSAPKALPTLNKLDQTAIYAMLLFRLSKQPAANQFREDMEAFKTAYLTRMNLEDVPQNLWYRICDAVDTALEEEIIKCKTDMGNIAPLAMTEVNDPTINGISIFGYPTFLNQDAGPGTESAFVAFGVAAKEFAAWAQSRSWSPDEEQLIPDFDPDFPVSKDAIKIAHRFVTTNSDRRPMVNFLWRGKSSAGKSTGVECIAALLHTPLLRMTCHTSMETQDFLSNFVPNTDSAAAAQKDLPSYEDLLYDPDWAYEKLTGEHIEGVDGKRLMEAYNTAVTALSSQKEARFKHVESPFVRALERGYIIEIQEISRIRDPGVLVGLNEYDRKGARIPRVDGSYAVRDPKAMVIYTDNVGLVSCRPVDPSVLRRMAMILDARDLCKEDILARVEYNTGFENKQILNDMYNTFTAIEEHCRNQNIVDGSLTVTELEMWAQCVKADGYSHVYENCIDCVISKATANREEQDEIISSILSMATAK